MAGMNALLAIAVIAFFPIGLKTISAEGMILSAFGTFMERVTKLPHWLRTPLWTCERCMCSMWGVPAALGVLYAPWWIMWPLLAITAVGVQRLIEEP